VFAAFYAMSTRLARSRAALRRSRAAATRGAVGVGSRSLEARYDRGAVVEDPRHIEQLARDKRRAHDLRGRDLLRTTCKNADAMLEALALRGEPLGGHTARLLKLLARYGAAELDRALADGLARGAVGAASIAHILDQRARGRRAAPPLEAVLPDDPRVRDLHVTPHELDRYDDLYADEEKQR
jgi:hypothetical protein